jgi:two-component sensor histidine kinase
LRTLTFAAGIGATVFNLLEVQDALRQSTDIRPWYGDSAMAILWGPPILLAILAPLASLSVLRAIAATTAIAFPIALALWMPEMTVSVMSHAASPWLLNLMAVFTSMAALAWSVRVASIYTLITCLGGGILRFASDGGRAAVAIQDTLYMLLVSVVFLGLIHTTKRIAGQLDSAAIAATHEATRAARNRAAERENNQFNALVHDDIIATLLAAARPTNNADAMLRQHAVVALEKLKELSKGRIRTEPYTAIEFVARLRSTISDHSEGIPLDVDIRSALLIDTAIAAAISEALAEGLRNSMQHAKPKDGHSLVSRSVAVSLSPTDVCVRLSDSGQGFSASRVGAERLGIAVSITSRMAAQPGGYSSVKSNNEGTIVVLGWKRP